MSELPDPRGSAAVLIGTSVYDDSTWQPLPAVTNNVHDLASTFADEELWGLPPDRAVVLLDRDEPAEVVTELVDNSRRAEDTLIVYFAGHGVLSRDGRLHLANRRTRHDLLDLTAVPYSLVRQVVDQCRARRRIIILDCCFSGRAVRAMTDTASAVIGQVDVEGTYVLTSSPGTSVSIAPEGARHTAFTQGLLATLRDGVAGRAEVLSLNDVYEDVMQAMARFGWPRPQQLGSNLIGRLGIVRNRAMRLFFPPRGPSPDSVPERSADDLRRAEMAAGVSAAVQIASERFGEPGADGLRTLRESPEDDAHREAGRALVLDTMHAMREQYGDGATLSAITLGRLIVGLHALLQNGKDQDDLDARLAIEAADLRQRILETGASTSTAGPPAPTAAWDIRRAVTTAIGADEIGDAIIDACEHVGAERVEVHPGTAPTGVEDGSFTIATRVLSPNMLAGSIAMVTPLIAVSTDGKIDEGAIRVVLGQDRRDLLIIAPKVSPSTIRALLHLCARIVVVRPTDSRMDLATLRRRLLDVNGSTCGTAQRVFVFAESTTIDRPTLSLNLVQSRRIVHVAGGEERMEVAVRALAAARAATHGPVVPDGPRLLTQVANSSSRMAPDDLTAAVRDVMRQAAAEPDRRIESVSINDASQRGDCVTILVGALNHATASARRFLS